MDPGTSVLITGIALLILLFIGVPVAFALAISGLLGFALLGGIGSGIHLLGIFPFTKLCTFLFTLIPMFILMGQVAYSAGLTRDAYDTFSKWVGHIPGGLGIATVLAGAWFAACCGVSIAAAAALGKATIPEMKRYGYHQGISAGCVAGAGLLSILIPPSVSLVLYGIMTGESIGKLLIAGVIPGFVTIVIFSLLLSIMALTNPVLMPRASKVGWKEKVLALLPSAKILILFIIIVGGIYTGVFTPMEAGAMAALAATVMALVALLRKQYNKREIWQAFEETVFVSTMILILLVGAAIFSTFLAKAGLVEQLGQVLANLSPSIGLALICLSYIPLGMFLDPASLIIITVPLFYPVIIGMGWDGVWFGVILTKMIEISLITPPVGLNVYVVKGVAPDIPLGDIFLGSSLFLIGEAIVVAILIAFPQIVTWLPSTMMH